MKCCLKSKKREVVLGIYSGILLIHKKERNWVIWPLYAVSKSKLIHKTDSQTYRMNL